MERQDRHQALLRAGFESAEAAQAALGNLYRRRERILSHRLDVSVLGGGEFANRAIDEADRRDLNRRIDQAHGLDEIDRQIARIERLLAQMGDE